MGPRVAILATLLASGCYVENRRLQGNTAMTAAMFDDLFYALARYEQVCGGYPATLDALERPRAGSTADCDHLGSFVDAVRAAGLFQEGDKLGMFQHSVDDLARLRERGVYREYRFQYAPRDSRGNGRYGGYALSADPLERGVTGSFSFWVSERGEIRASRDHKAGPDDAVYRTVVRRPPPLPRTPAASADPAGTSPSPRSPSPP
jgi:hypothetical protein